MELLSAAAIRRCLGADPGFLMITADFDQVELRVAAGLSGEQSLIDAAKRGESLHETAALRMFGEGFNEDQKRYAKNVNFGWLFGGGAKTLAEQAGISIGKAAAIIRDYEAAFKALTAYKRRMTDQVLRSALNPFQYKQYQALKRQMYYYDFNTKEGKAARARLHLEIKRLCYRKVGHVITPSGRRLVVDAEKPYTAVNYIVQSTAADLMKQALLDVMADAECFPYVLLPIHDEILGQAPARDAEYFAQRFAEIMTREFMGVPIDASGKVLGKTWGDGYGKKAEELIIKKTTKDRKRRRRLVSV